MSESKSFIGKFRSIQNHIIPTNKIERNLFFQEVAYENFSRLIFVCLAYFIFEAWILYTSIGRELDSRYMLVILVVIYGAEEFMLILTNTDCEKADQALYQAKTNGRNCVVTL